MTSNIATELSNFLNNSRTQIEEMRAKAQNRLQEIEAEREELHKLLDNLDSLTGTSKKAVSEHAPRPQRRARRTRKPRALPQPAGQTESTTGATSTSDAVPMNEHWAEMTTAVMDVIRTKGPVTVKGITETIGSKVKGIRYDTVSMILAANKGRLKVEGRRPRIYSIAS